MSNLTFLEKQILEQLLGMKSGYVLHFSNREFQELVADATRLNIYDAKYDHGSGSKANRLRAFWSKESNYIVAKLLRTLLACVNSESSLDDECELIVQRLEQDAPVTDMAAIANLSNEKDFDVLVNSIYRSIENNEPEAGLDRLHTFVVKYVRTLCKKHGLAVDRAKPLHSIFGEYVKCVRAKGLIESHMAERILKASISVLESFNDVRNEKSLAHDNKILGYNESLLIFNHVTNSIRFIRFIEENLLSTSYFGG